MLNKQATHIVQFLAESLARIITLAAQSVICETLIRQKQSLQFQRDLLHMPDER